MRLSFYNQSLYLHIDKPIRKICYWISICFSFCKVKTLTYLQLGSYVESLLIIVSDKMKFFSLIAPQNEIFNCEGIEINLCTYHQITFFIEGIMR